MNGMLRAVATAAVLAALLVGPGQAFAAFPGSNGELLFDASVDPDFDGVGTPMIGTLDPATGVPSMLTEGSDPASAPDGVRIAFVRAGDIWVRDGAGNERRLAADPASDREPAWSPDGATIVFTSERAGGPDLYSVDLSSDTVQRLTVGGGTAANSEPVWSPERGRIAFTRETPDWAGSAPELWLMEAPGTAGASFPIDPAAEARQLTARPCPDDGTGCVPVPNTFGASGGSASWSPDGTELAFASGGAIRGNLYAIRVADPTVGRRLAAIDVTHTSLAWSPDGQAIAFVRRHVFGDHRLSTMLSDGTEDRLVFTTCCGYEHIAPSGNVDWRPLATLAANTPVGADVSVPLPGVTVRFAEVTAAGDTIVVSSANGPPAPTGFRLVGVYHEISTTATYTGRVTVCLDTTDPQARLEHFENNSWRDVTISSSPTQVCGEVDSLSPFALFVPSDTTAPVLHLPADITVDATGPAGATVGYPMTASDDQDPNPAIACAPPSGATFGIGQTTVDCTATDAAGNAANGSFVVTVRGAAAQIVVLIDKTLDYLELPSLEATLKTRLESAAAALIAKNKAAACRALTFYIAAVKLAPASALSAAEKTDLIADATRIKTVVGCP